MGLNSNYMGLPITYYVIKLTLVLGYALNAPRRAHGVGVGGGGFLFAHYVLIIAV